MWVQVSRQLLMEVGESEMFEEAGLVVSKDVWRKKEVRANTRRVYQQRKFNLLREESEGYAKLATLLSAAGAGRVTAATAGAALAEMQALIGGAGASAGLGGGVMGGVGQRAAAPCRVAPPRGAGGPEVVEQPLGGSRVLLKSSSSGGWAVAAGVRRDFRGSCLGNCSSCMQPSVALTCTSCVSPSLSRGPAGGSLAASQPASQSLPVSVSGLLPSDL